MNEWVLRECFYCVYLSMFFVVHYDVIRIALFRMSACFLESRKIKITDIYNNHSQETHTSTLESMLSVYLFLLEKFIRLGKVVCADVFSDVAPGG
jgi:hypothetical protein